MSNWGSALGGFATGFQTGYSTTASAIDRYERRQAEKELRGELEAANLARQNALKDTPEVEGLKDAAPDKFTILENETGKKTAIDLDKVGKDDPTARERLKAFTAAQKAVAPKSQPSAMGRTGEIDFYDPRIAKFASQDKPAPVEDRSTPIDMGDPRIPRYYSQRTPAPVEDRSTPIQPRTAAGSKQTRAINAAGTGMTDRERKARLASKNMGTAPQFTPAPKASNSSAPRDNGGLMDAIRRDNAGRNARKESLARGEGLPADQIKKTQAKQGYRPLPTDNQSIYERISGTIDNRRKSAALLNDEVSRRNAAGNMESYYRAKEFSGRALEGAPGEGSAPASMRGAIQQMGPEYQDNGQYSRPSVGPNLPEGGKPQQSIQPSALNGGALGARQGITANDVLTPEQRIAEADRRYNNQVRQAELKYLLKTNPEKGLQVAKQYVIEDARQEFSDNVRRAMSGDPEGIRYFLPYANVITGKNLRLGEDGRTLYELDANGQPVPTDLNVGQLQSILGQSYMIHMMSAGMAFDKILPMMTALNKDARETQETAIKQQNANSLAQLRKGTIDAKLAENNQYYYGEDALGEGRRPIYERENGRLVGYEDSNGNTVPANPDDVAMAEHARELGLDVALIKPYGWVAIDKDRNISRDPEELLRVGVTPANPNASGTNQQPRRALAFSDDGVGLIKGLEGYSATPYSDYTQSSIGYGTKALPGDTRITEQEAEQRLRNYVAQNIEPQLNEALGDTLVTQKEYDALVSLAYNVGTPTLLRSRAFQLLKDGDREGFRREVADRDRGFTKVRGPNGQLVVNPGLLARREKEMDYFFG